MWNHLLQKQRQNSQKVEKHQTSKEDERYPTASPYWRRVLGPAYVGIEASVLGTKVDDLKVAGRNVEDPELLQHL
jgi:hypothetical protein